MTSETHNAQNFEPAENSPDIAGSFKEITSSAEWESSVDKMYKTTYRIFIPINSSKINTGEEATKMVESREICIHHKTLTSIARVGLQVWRGAFLLADYIIHNRICIQSNIIVDLGCGTGIIGVILNACNHVGSVYLTDYSEEIVQLAELNVQQNYKEAEAYDPRDSVVAARVLDWTSNSNPRLQLPIDSAGIHASVAWTSDDIRRLGDSHLLCVAADVIYDDILTTSLFRKAAQIMKPGEHIWLSLEKRYNFSIEDKELVANGYELFLKHVTSIPKDAVHPECIQKPSFVYDSPFGETIVCFQGRKCPINFPQRFFDYDRTQDLELWDIELVTLPLM